MGPPAPPGPPSKTPRRLLLIGAIVLVAVFIGIGAYVASFLFSGETGGRGPSGPTKEPSRAKPVESAAIEKPLQAIGFACYPTLEKETTLRSCYRTEPDGLRYAVRIQADAGKKVVQVRVESLPLSYFLYEGRTGGKAVEPLKQILPVVSKALLGPDAEKVPSLDAGPERRADIAWGTIELNASGPSGVAKLFKKGAPAWPSEGALDKDKNAVYTGLKGAGYDCDPYGCEKGLATSKASDEESSIEVEQPGGKLSSGKLKGPFADLLEVTMGSADRQAAQQWVDGHLDPKNGTADADIGGVHLRVDRRADGGSLTITPLLARS